MIEKITSDGGEHPNGYDFMQKINEIIDWINQNNHEYGSIFDVVKATEESKTINTSYHTNGLAKEFYGQKGTCVQFDYPLPAGYMITIKEK